MHDDVQIVKQHPSREWFSLNMMGKKIEFLLDRLPNAFGQGSYLPLTCAIAYDEKVRENADVTEIQQDNFFSQFVFDNIDDFSCQINRFQC